MAGKCIKPECECLDYCEAEDPFGKPQARVREEIPEDTMPEPDFEALRAERNNEN